MADLDSMERQARMTSERRILMSSTAYRYWEQVWRDPTGRQAWESPSPWVESMARAWHHLGIRTVLDLGCGVGRHCVSLARSGLYLTGLDRSEAAIERSRRACAEAGVAVTLVSGDLAELPFAAGAFDAVLAYNVVYHGDEQRLGACLKEIARVLSPRGRYAATMLSKRNAEYGKGVEIAPNTFVQDGVEDDKIHPHLYCDAADLVRLHDHFDMLSCVDAEQEAPRSFHWYCEFEVRG